MSNREREEKAAVAGVGGGAVLSQEEFSQGLWENFCCELADDTFAWV